jgi:hypothetical protein
MDRCALFVDAGYVLADGAMAVHGTRRRDSVSWDYPGLLKLLASISRDRTGLPLMRCYWYEATVEGRRTREHDMLADLPGLKLRLGRMRPGHREGVETEIHRDLITLARNGAICDAVIISAEEDLAQVVAEVQDLGVRVILLHVAVDGSWTIARPLRQECDDVVEISAAHLRPFVDLITGAEPAGPGEQYPNGGHRARALGNGHSPNLGALTHQDLPGTALPPADASYPPPVSTDYQRGALPGPAAQEPPGQQLPSPARSEGLPGAGYGRSGETPGPGQGSGGGAHVQRASSGGLHEQGQDSRGRAGSAAGTGWLDPRDQQGRARAGQHEPGYHESRQHEPGYHEPGHHEPGHHEPGQGRTAGAPESAGGRPGPADGGPEPVVGDLQARPELRNPPASHARRIDEEATIDGYRDYPQPDPLAGRRPPQGPETMGRPAAAPAGSPAPGRELADGAGQQYLPAPTGGGFGRGLPPQLPPAPRAPAQLPPSQFPARYGQPPPGPMVPPSGRQPDGPFGGPQPDGPYTGPQPVTGQPPVPQPVTVSLTDAVQAAHAEGFGFGDAVARDAPALWLEAVLARKPRMPSDLEARLLQGSALPIDSLLHDEVRHALRRGFWDALERSRR